MGKYDDIINLPHHVSDFHKPMPMENRAAQFAPFAALSGHDDVIAETSRITEDKKDLSEEEIIMLSHNLNYALNNKVKAKISFYVPDEKKKGGSYKTIKGFIKKLDELERLIILNDGSKIPISCVSEIEIV